MVKNLKPFDVPVLNYVGHGGCQTEAFQISEEVCASGAVFHIIFELGLVFYFIFVFFYSLKQMSALGIYSRLDQVFGAPTAVKEVLTSQFGLDRSVCIPSLLFPCILAKKL